MYTISDCDKGCETKGNVECFSLTLEMLFAPELNEYRVKNNCLSEKNYQGHHKIDYACRSSLQNQYLEQLIVRAVNTCC